jgi:CAAX protease family protein
MRSRSTERSFLVTIAIAVVVGLAIATLGVVPWNIFAQLNVRWWPSLPWSVPAGLLWLVLFWSYLNGGGPPASTTQIRRELLRARPLHGPAARWCAFASASGLIALLMLYLVTIQFVDLPTDAFRPRSVATLPLTVVIAAMLMSAIIAGVVEEAAYRGYMQGILERRFRAPIAIAIVTVVFTGLHLLGGTKILPLALPVCATSIFLGALTAITRSVLPATFVHALADMMTLPVEWRLVGELPVGRFYNIGFDGLLLLTLLILVAGSAAAIAALLKLRSTVRFAET